MDTLTRFLAKVDQSGDCWLWTANTDSSGYGSFKLNGHQVGAHRVSYELHVGPIPAGMSIDHACRVRRCVNPAHLSPMTLRENQAKAQAELRAEVRSRGECRNGHPYTSDSVYERNGTWFCRVCNSEAQRRRRLNAKAVSL